jgi:hypothetical protein
LTIAALVRYSPRNFGRGQFIQFGGAAMFCTRCGTRIDQGDNFCRHCGVRIERRDAAGNSAAETGSAASLRAPTQPSAKAGARASAPDLKTGMTRKAVIAAVGLGLFLISAIGFYFARGSSEPVQLSQPKESPAATVLHSDPLSRSEENKDLPVAPDPGLASLNQSEVVEAPRAGESSKPAHTLPPPHKSQAQRSVQDSARNSRPTPAPASRSGAKAGVYETVQSTTIYENPSAAANVVADIPAGVRINVVSATGDWLEVHSRRGNPPGFIRRGDAVFVENPD